MQRPVILAGLLGAAVGVPYVVDRHSGTVSPTVAPAANLTAVDTSAAPPLNLARR